MTRVQSTVKPSEVEVDAFHVWIAENIEEVEVEHENGVDTLYEFDLTKMEKDDYIKHLHAEQVQMKEENDLALADLAETLLGGGF